MRVKVKQVGGGSHPSEVVVSVSTADGGHEELVVDRRSLKNDTLRIGYPIAETKDRWLVELPRETVRGFWRVWVPPSMVVEETG